MQKIKTLSVFIAITALWPLSAQASNKAGLCGFYEKGQPTAETETSDATMTRLDSGRAGPIFYNSSTETSPTRDNLLASPPFEAKDQLSAMTADGVAAIAPSLAASPSVLSSTSVQYAERADSQDARPNNNEAVMSVEEKWNAALKTYVQPTGEDGLARFDYAALAASSSEKSVLDKYIQYLEGMDPTSMSDEEAIAYWANLYNAVTVQQIIENYPVTSIKEIKSGLFSSGPWKKDLVTVNGREMSLDDIEHETLRKQFPSPLIHYMVNCASVGCPNLKDGLWTAKTLDSDRDVAARAFINSPRGAEITDKGLRVSSIYKWFVEDFGGDKKGVLAHLSRYAEGDLKAAIDGGAKIIDYDYDWSLNE